MATQSELGQILYYMPDLTSWISLFQNRGFHSFKIVDFTLPEKVQIIMCKTDLDLIWMAWSGFGQTHLVWKPTGVQKSSGSVLAECNQPAASFALSDSVAFFHRCPEPYYCTKPARIWFGSSWLCQVSAKRIQCESKPMCKNHWACFWTTLPSWSRSGASRIQHVYHNSFSLFLSLGHLWVDGVNQQMVPSNILMTCSLLVTSRGRWPSEFTVLMSAPNSSSKLTTSYTHKIQCK